MGDLLDDSIQIIEEDDSVASGSFVAPKSPKPAKVAATSSVDSADVVVLKGNALYARLAVLMGASVSTADALAEMKEMSKQIASRKRAAGVSELWDAGEEVGEAAGAGLPPGNNRPPPKRIGPPAAPVAGSSIRLLTSPLAEKRTGKQATATDKSSSSGSEESQDAPVERAKLSSSDPKTSNKLCIVCHESASAANQLLTCAVCTLHTHAKCAKPTIDKEELSSARFSFTCSSCTRRPRSESPKPTRAAIQITAPHDRRKKANEAPSNLSKSDEARRKRLEGGEVKKKKSEEL